MRVGFEETMAGTFCANSGEESPMIFHVQAAASEAKAFITGTPMSLQGTVTIGGLVRDSPATGTLEVKAIRDRELVYQLQFEDESGAALHYLARKTITVRHLLSSMTTLVGRVYRGTEMLGKGTVTFDLRHLPEFLRSFRVSR
jgi:hypothetical protein